MSSIHCDLCKKDVPYKPFYPSHDIVQCPECGLVQYAKKVTTQDVYDANYFTGGEYVDYRLDRPALEENFRRRLDHLKQYVSSGRLFEVGSAYGYFLNLAKNSFKVAGVDVVDAGVKNAREEFGLDVSLGEFTALPKPAEPYDLICMWDTIEHLTHPFDYLKQASEWLKPGGYLALTTGDIGSFVAKTRKSKWRMIHPPTHLYYFDRKTITKALEQQGLEVVHYSHVGVTRSYRSMVHQIFNWSQTEKTAIYKILTLNGKLEFFPTLNLYDIMYVVARKKV